MILIGCSPAQIPIICLFPCAGFIAHEVPQTLFFTCAGPKAMLLTSLGPKALFPTSGGSPSLFLTWGGSPSLFYFTCWGSPSLFFNCRWSPLTVFTSIKVWIPSCDFYLWMIHITVYTLGSLTLFLTCGEFLLQFITWIGFSSLFLIWWWSLSLFKTFRGLLQWFWWDASPALNCLPVQDPQHCFVFWKHAARTISWIEIWGNH